MLLQQKQVVLDTITEEACASKRRELEQSFKLIYESLRTISLFPAVRDMEGGSRRPEAEDVVKEGRFTSEAEATVQQLCNNLASNVPIAEIYAVVTGLDHNKGEVPFFMYDSLGREANQPEHADSGNVGAYGPEESEAAAYKYFPAQMAEFAAGFPHFAYSSLTDIPAVFSPAMRTCDNTQYVAKTSGQLRDAVDIVYSVPFYDRSSGAFKGIVTAILRTDVLQAKRLGVPFLIITAAERHKARDLQFERPATPSAFVLTNDRYGIVIADRRVPKPADEARVAAQQRPDDLVQAPLRTWAAVTGA